MNSKLLVIAAFMALTITVACQRQTDPVIVTATPDIPLL